MAEEYKYPVCGATMDNKGVLKQHAKDQHNREMTDEEIEEAKT